MSRARSAAVAATVSLSMAITPLMVPPAAVADEFALRSAAPVGSSSVIPDLTPADIDAVLPAALQMWGETGLAGAVVRIGDVSGDRLAVTSGRTITIDMDAAGRGWFVDSTPSTSGEFTQRSGDVARASDSSPAAGRFDLQTVLAHEIGHLLGRADLGRADAIMHESLRPGERHLTRGVDAGARVSVLRALAAGAELPLTAATDAVTDDPAATDPGATEPAAPPVAELAPAPAEAPAAEPAPVVDPAAAAPDSAATTDPAAESVATPAAEDPATADVAAEDPTAAQPAAPEASLTVTVLAAATPWSISIAGTVTVTVDGTDLVIGSERRALDTISALAIAGSSGDDTVVFTAAALAALAGIGITFDGSAGSDTVTGPAGSVQWTLTGAGAGVLTSGAASVAFTGVERLQGTGTDTLAGGAADTQWVIDGPGTGFTGDISFSGIDTVVGGSGADAFAMRSTGSIGSIAGGGGANTLVGPDAANTWTVSGADAGTLGTTSFTGIGTLVGGNADDTFKVLAGGALSGGVEGGAVADAAAAPVDVLDFSARGGQIVAILAGGAVDIATAFSAATAGAPAAGTVRLNTPDQNQATQVVISTTDAAGASVAASIDRIDTSQSGGQLLISGVDDPSAWILFRVLGISAPGLPGESRTVSVQVIAASAASPFAGGIDVTLSYVPPVNVVAGFGTFSGIDELVGSASGSDSIRGPPDASVRWTIDGVNSGTVAGIAFSSIENLVGTANNADVFDVVGTGSIGSVAGGSGGTDILVISCVVLCGSISGALYNISGTDAAGTASLYGRVIAYTGLDQQTPFLTVGGDTVRITGTASNDTITISAHPTDPNRMRVDYGSHGWYDPITQVVTTVIEFAVPSTSLVVEGLDGADTIVVTGLAAGWVSEATFIVYGNRRLSDDMPIFVDDPEADSVTFTGDVWTNDGVMEIYAAHITVNANVAIDTGAGWVTFRARQIGSAFAENLSPVFATDRNVSITVGDGATIHATGIFFIAQAEDRSLAEYLGVAREVGSYVLDPLTGLLGSIIALPVKLLLKKSTATITIGVGAQLIGDDTVGMYATAAAVANGTARGSLVSAGFVQATATATVIIKKDALITSTAAIVITATANAGASISASTEREIKSLANPGGTQVAIAVAVSNAVANAHIDVAAGAVIEAGKTANLVAGGTVESEAEAESGMYADGSAGLAFSIELSKADVTTVVNGTVIAHMTPCEDLTGTLTGCSTVKIEIDPLVTNITDVGYVDYAYDRIHVGMHGLVTEDTVTYSPRRGSNIGGLVGGRTYFVVWMADDPTTLDLNESEFIALASSEQAAVRAASCSAAGDDHAAYLAYLVCLQQVTVDLTQAGFPATTNNTRDFSAADVDAAANTVTLHWTGGVFNTFELGQAVVYHQKGDAKIDGLVDGATYYVVASTN